jgi:hypothetical protein
LELRPKYIRLLNVIDEFPEFINCAYFTVLVANGTFRQFILFVINVGQALQQLHKHKAGRITRVGGRSYFDGRNLQGRATDRERERERERRFD